MPVSETPPQPGWVTHGRIVSNYDGDTVTVEIVKRFNIRLLDCWAPELNEPGGKESRDHLAELCKAKPGEEVTIVIQGDVDFKHVVSMSRVLGKVYNGNVNLSAAQCEAGHATAEKTKEQK